MARQPSCTRPSPEPEAHQHANNYGPGRQAARRHHGRMAGSPRPGNPGDEEDWAQDLLRYSVGAALILCGRGVVRVEGRKSVLFLKQFDDADGALIERDGEPAPSATLESVQPDFRR